MLAAGFGSAAFVASVGFYDSIDTDLRSPCGGNAGFAKGGECHRWDSSITPHSSFCLAGLLRLRNARLSLPLGGSPPSTPNERAYREEETTKRRELLPLRLTGPQNNRWSGTRLSSICRRSRTALHHTPPHIQRRGMTPGRVLLPSFHRSQIRGVRVWADEASSSVGCTAGDANSVGIPSVTHSSAAEEV